MEFTILMPCLNEEETLGTCIQKARHSIERNQLHAEILISDNGSTDNSICIAESLGARVIHASEKGYGNALRHGIEKAKGKYIIMADADDSYDFNDLLPFVTKLREGNDLVVGNRFLGGIEANAMPFLHRYLGNPVLTNLGRLFFNIPLGDFHCGFRGFNRQAIIDIRLSATGMEFASEMIVKSSQYSQKIAEVSVKLYRDGRSRAPHLRTWRDGWRHLRFLLLFAPKWLFLYPGVMMVLLGVSISAALLPGPFSLGAVTFDVHTMLYAAIVTLIGNQMITFYFFSKIFAIRMALEKNDSWMSGFDKYFTLERGLALGGSLLFMGILLTIYSITVWNDSSFGNLQPTLMLRIIIPAVTLLMLGIQIIFNSFFAGVLSIKTQ
jgi:glycosyltransferase involved in cell wall biosynthesis